MFRFVATQGEWDQFTMAKVWTAGTMFLTFALAGPAVAAQPAEHDPCSFLKIDEVEAIMGPLAGPPFRTGASATPNPDGNDCRYETPDRRSIRLNVKWRGGKNLLSMMGSVQAMVEGAGLKQLKLVDGSTIAGHWDQAAINGCCAFNALRDDQVVNVDIGGSNASIAQAASLAEAAIQRLDQPLDISGTAGIQAAQERAAQRPKPRNVCDLLTRADAEAIAGVPLSQQPQGTNNNCNYVWPMKALGSEFEIKLVVAWQGGFSDMRATRAAVGNASSMLGMGKLQAKPGVNQNTGPWDDYSQSIIGVSAVKGDVLVSVEGGPFRQDVQQAFVEKALANLDK